jgi:hypothetical protein
MFIMAAKQLTQNIEGKELSFGDQERLLKICD